MNNEHHHNHQTTHLSLKFPKVAQLQICFNLAPCTPLDMIWSKGRYLHSHFLFIEILFQNLLKDSVVDGYPLHIWLDLVTLGKSEDQHMMVFINGADIHVQRTNFFHYIKVELRVKSWYVSVVCYPLLLEDPERSFEECEHVQYAYSEESKKRHLDPSPKILWLLKSTFSKNWHWPKFLVLGCIS